MNKDSATKVSPLLLETLKNLDDIVLLAQKGCENDEFIQYRTNVGRVMGHLVTVMNQFYKEHPEFKPPELD